MRSSTPSWPSLRIAFVLVAATALALSAVACGGASGPTVSGAWVRPPQGMDRPAAGYLVIKGGSQADALVGAAYAGATMVEIHETTMDSSGMSGMQSVTKIDVPAGASVELKPGGYHLMLMGVAEGELSVGETVQIELTFEKAGKVVVQAEVRAG